MNEQIFRQKSLDKVKSPENLDDYIQVSNPSVWLLLISIIVFLAGACVWGAFGHIDSTVPVNVRSENGELTAFVDYGAVSDMHEGMVVRVKGVETTISHILREGDNFVCTLKTDKTIPDGFYEGKIVIESIRPLSFILN